MKKKVYLQVSVVLCIVLTLFLVIMAAAVYAVIYVFQQGLSSLEHWIGLVAAIGGFGFFGYSFLELARHKIVLNATEIFVPEQWRSKENKIQYEVRLPYASIENISMTVSAKNSKGKTALWVFTSMPYIVFELDNGKQESVNVLYFTKKQTVKIIDEVIERAKKQGNTIGEKTGTELLSELIQLQKRKRR